MYEGSAICFHLKMFPLISFSPLLILISIPFVFSSTDYFLLPLDPICHPCSIPHPTTVHWIPYSRPPCFHPGQPIFQWPQGDNCTVPDDFHSDSISVDPNGLVFAKDRLCFYETIHLIRYRFHCNGEWINGRMKLGHIVYTKQRRRQKRWLRRRNPNQGVIHFQQESYIKEMLEDSTVSSVVLSVKATHAADLPIYYSMAAPQDARSQNIFTLDTITGDIRLAKSLDRETLDKHVLKVTAYERLDPTVSASTTVVVDVIDVQDNSPVFERDSYFADIREDAPIGTTVLSVFARDLDDGPNGEVEYSLETGEGSNLLSINTKSGVIQTAANLDRETVNLIRLNVIASDHGTTVKSSSALIEVNILDVNDNPPLFEQETYNITVLENTTIPVTIARLKAIDADAGTNGQVHYGMVTSSDIIHVDYRTGEVTLRKKVDARNSPLSFLVRAKDGAQPALTSTATLTIHVIDINDHIPRFIAAQKQIIIDESISIGEEVGRVYAIDEDSGINGRVRYTIEGSEDFTINNETGVIYTAREVDREENQRYELKITASDGGIPSLNSTTSITVIVKDVNDNAPLFDPSVYNLTLSEETPLGSQILVLKAIDKDENSKIVYKIEEQDRDVVALIDMSDQGAFLSLFRELRSSDHLIRILISATDEGGMRGLCTVNIQVDDVNSPPRFTIQPFSVRIPEDSPLGFHVITMKAEDHDRGENAKVTYSIDSEEFTIDSDSGLITVVSPLDREEQSSYSITVTASDNADPPLNSTTQIEVILDDVNDNAPEFTSLNYTRSISEDIAVGTSFLQVSANDFDSGVNGLIDYFLNDSDTVVGMDLFRLDRTSGTLRVNQKLDRENISVISLPIFARDRGNPPLSSNSVVTVVLEDVNDNSPQFESSSYSLWIAENSPIGSVVGTLVATDPDEGANAEIEFRIFGGTDAKLFDIETDSLQKGVVRILTRSGFDYEAKTNKYNVEVQAISGQLSSTVPVIVHVSDVNDNRPQLRDFLLLVTQFHGDTVNRDIGTVPAFDPDQNATLEYSMEQNELLAVDRYSGQITLKGVWKRNLEASFKTCVTDGPNTVCAQCRLLFSYIEPNWLTEAATVVIGHTTVDDFLDPPVFTRFRQSIASVSSWDESDVMIFGINKSNQSVHVSFVVLDRGELESSWKVSDSISSNLPRLSSLSLLDIRLLPSDSCQREPCPYYQKCRETLKFSGVQFHQTDNFIARTLKTLKTFVCECPNGFSSSPDFPDQCNIRVDQCYSNPCRHNGSCHSLENGYRCQCAKGWRGQNCEFSESVSTCLPGYCMSGSQCVIQREKIECRRCKYEEEDTDERCRLRSLNFPGHSLLHINKNPSRIEWEIQLRIATISREGTILFMGDRKSDFLELSIHDRILRAEFSLGGKSKTLKMDGERRNRLNDGQWHTVTLKYYDRKLTLFLDYCDPFTSQHTVGGFNCAMETKLELPPKCLDPTVPCYRFFDISSGMFIGGKPSINQKVENGYSGCISNVTLDGQLIDFSKLSEMDKIGTISEGCGAKRNFCVDSNQCAPGANCVNRWMGHNCRCPHTTHQLGQCSKDSSRYKPLSFHEDESFVRWKIPEAAIVPFELGFEFRTNRDDTQIIAVEFDKRNVFYLLTLEDGLLKATLGKSSVTVPCPVVGRGHWTLVEIEYKEEEVTTIIDGIYTVSLPHPYPDLSVSSLYTGLSPSSSHPSRFEGCLRDVQVNGVALNTELQGKIRQGCISMNGCQHGSCPENSVCKKEWNSHSCHCDKGYAGGSCLPVCSLKGICGSEGYCQMTNTTKGYECQCANGLSGPNCDRPSPTQLCPPGWWGMFGECRQCNCQTHRGFTHQCDSNTGQCLCPKFWFVSDNRCVPCECGLGSTSLECSSNGQCNCGGEAVGRRCDRCSSDKQVLDPKSLKCLSLRDRCPSQIDYGIQWPITVRGAVARQSCPYTEVGLATRICGADGKWKDVNNYNCTRPEYSAVIGKLGSMSASDLVAAVYNATQDTVSIRGRNLEIARSVLERILEGEIRYRETDRSHFFDYTFTERLVESTAEILTRESPLEYGLLSSRLDAYGKAVFELHEKLPFLAPFCVQSENILFVVDRLDFSNTVPKFNNFIDRRNSIFPNVAITVEGATQVFYQVLPYPRCLRCETALVSVQANTTRPIIVEFPLREDSGWRYPECVRFDLHSRDHWTPQGALLIGLNTTHAVCQYEESGMYTILLRVDQGAFFRLSHHSTVASPITAGIALFVCSLSILCTLFRRGIRTKLIRVGFIVFFICNAANIYFIHKTSINKVFCPIRNAILSFTTTTPFTWLFLYSLHIYRMLADGNPNSSATVCLLIGLIFPCILSSGTFLLTDSCSLSPSGWLFWSILIPVALFLLLSFYASATSFLVSRNKQYDVVVVKFSLRKALLQHFLLTSMTLGYTVVGLLLPLTNFPSPFAEIISNTMLVITSLYIFVWSCCMGSGGNNRNDLNNLWLEGEPQKSIMIESTTEQQCHSPLLDHEDNPAWMPDLIPNDPYRTSTPRENPLTNTILSPANKILQPQDSVDYGNMSTLPRFGGYDDQMEDAYYTYTRRKQPTTTFNR